VVGAAERDRSIALGLLSFAAGVMDAIAFLALGEVFTSAMSGNTILLGLAIGQGRLPAALHSLTAFLGYIAGVALAALPLHRNLGIARILVLEALFLAAFAAFWTFCGGPAGPFEVYPLILLSAVAMGLQGAVGRAVQIPGVPTVVITSTLTAIVGSFVERMLRRDRRLLTFASRQQLASFLVYLVSAGLAGVAATYWAELLPIMPLAAIVMLDIGLRLGWLEL
jgi:uncharacterized membrane protein YoaK (UPF0700 family)